MIKKDNIYNQTKFIECFCKRNKDFISGKQICSNDFIKTILLNINIIMKKNIKYEDYNPYNQM